MHLTALAFQLAYSPEVISHHLFGGSEVMRIMMLKIMLKKSLFTSQQDFRGGFKVLLPGGGTGDPIIQLCQELKGSNAEVKDNSWWFRL